MDTFWIFLFGLLTCSAFLLSLLAIDRPEGWASITLTGMMTVYWAVNVTVYFSASEKLYVLTDTAFAAVALLILVRLRYAWLAVLTALYFLTVGLDVMLIGTLGADPSSKHVEAYRWFANASNVVFILQLIAASFPGWWSLVTRIRHMRDRPKDRRPAIF